MVIVIVSRCLSIILPSLLFKKIKGENKWRLNTNELSIISFAGIIRGSVAFALITKLSVPSGPNADPEPM